MQEFQCRSWDRELSVQVCQSEPSLTKHCGAQKLIIIEDRHRERRQKSWRQRPGLTARGSWSCPWRCLTSWGSLQSSRSPASHGLQHEGCSWNLTVLIPMSCWKSWRLHPTRSAFLTLESFHARLRWKTVWWEATEWWSTTWRHCHRWWPGSSCPLPPCPQSLATPTYGSQGSNLKKTFLLPPFPLHLLSSAASPTPS